MNVSIISKEDQTKISQLFERMNDSPGKDSNKLAKDWLQTHNNSFSGFIDNKFLLKPEEADVYQLTNFSENIATVSPVSKETINKAVISCNNCRFWLTLQPIELSRYLYRIAETIEKNSELFAQVESLSSGKHLYRTKTKDVPNLIQSFYYYASVARDSNYSKDRINYGVVCVVAEEYNNPLPSLSWRVASVLATGNTVLLLVDVKTCVSAFLLAELCSLSGLPAGVLNIFPIDQEAIDSLPNIDKVIFTGEHSRSKKFIEMAVKQCAVCEVLVSQRPVVIAYENADLHSAASGVLEMLYFNDTRSKKSGCSVYVQASIKEKFHSLLEEKISKIRVGRNFTKTDMSCIVTSSQHEKLKLYLDKARQQQLKIVEGLEIKDSTYSHWTPTLIYDVPTTSKLLDETVEGPIIVTTPFRTVKESIAMFNHNKLGSDVSVWTEKLPLALEVIHRLRARTIWINTQNIFDASISYGGLGLSGNSIEGGIETFCAHLSFDKLLLDSDELVDSYGEAAPDGITFKNNPDIKFNYELHIGGSYKKPSGGKYTIVKTSKDKTPYAYMGLGSSADIQAAVSSAIAVQPKWQNLGKFKRLQILQKAADALTSKKIEIISLLSDLSGRNAEEEVNKSISRLLFWSNNTNYCDGQLIETQTCVKVLQERNPLGVIGIQVCNIQPLLSFVSTVIPAIAYGNAVVAVLESETCHIPSLKLCEILQSSGVLGGTVNLITGCCKHLTRHLALNMNIDAVWYCCNDSGLFIHKSCSTHPKRVFDCDYSSLSFNELIQKSLVSECTFVKNIYMPLGDIFAN